MGLNMNKNFGAARRLTLTAALLAVASSSVLAVGILPGAFKIVDNGKVVRKKAKGMTVAKIVNTGPDTIVASSKGTLKTHTITLGPGEKYGLLLPPGGKNVKLVDGNFDNGTGAKGYVFWAKKLPNAAGWGGGTGQQ